MMAERDRLLAENERLRRENKELRDKLETYGVCSGGIITLFASGIGEREAENEKLRELMRIMYGELVACEDNGYVCGGHKFDDRLRELGVEVDG